MEATEAEFWVKLRLIDLFISLEMLELELSALFDGNLLFAFIGFVSSSPTSVFQLVYKSGFGVNFLFEVFEADFLDLVCSHRFF